MDWSLLPLTAVFVVTIALSALVNTYLFAKAKKTVVFKWFMMIQAGLFLWLFGAYMEMLAPAGHISSIYVTLQHSGIFLLSWGWMLLGSILAGGTLSIRTKWVLGIISVMMMLSALTNPIHNQYMTKLTLADKEPGILLWISSCFIMINFVYGAVGFWRRAEAHEKKWRLTVALAGTGVVLCAVVSLPGGVIPGPQIAPVVAFLMFGVIALVNSNDLFLDISPVSLHAFMNSISDAVIITDGNNNIVDANNLGGLSLFVHSKGEQSITQFVEQIKRYVIDQNNGILEGICGVYLCQLQGEFVVEKGNESQWFSTVATPLFDENKRRIGGVITFHDITKEKRLIKALDEKNAELEKANIELKDYVMIANHLEEEREKSRIATEIQNSLGQKIVEILTVLEVLQLSVDKDRMLVKENLQKAIDACRDVLGEVRMSIARIMPAIRQSSTRGINKPEQRRRETLD